jgi:sugar phosphate isomerase/epimerase
VILSKGCDMPRSEAPVISLSSACLYHLPLRTVFHLAAEAGYGGIELVMGPEAALRGVSYLEHLARGYGLPITNVHQALYRMRPKTWRDLRLERATRMALSLGCPGVVIHGPWATDWGAPAAQRWLRELELCQRLTRGSDTRLTLENPGLYNNIDADNVLASFPALWRFASQQDLDITLDTCHVGTGQTGLLQAYEQLRPRITNVHLSDMRLASLPRGKLLRTVVSHHQFPGDGHLSLSNMLQRLVADRYTGSLTLEVSLFALRFWSWRVLRRRLAGAADFVRAALQSDVAAQPGQARLKQTSGISPT